jgi:phosphomannomutase
MKPPLMISVAGIRGIIGTSLTPPVLARFAAAFAQGLGDGPVVVGRDARTSGPMVYRAVAAGLTAAGRDVVNLGLATTPTTEVAVETLGAAGGVILTASHNPAEWNALKFLSSRGEFLDATAGADVKRRFESDDNLWVSFDRLGGEREESGALAWHLRRVLDLEELELDRIRSARLKVVVDGCASVGGLAVPEILREMGVEVVELDCEPNGRFTRELEPLPEHLGRLGATVAEKGAHFGVAVDPDADRAAFVDARGVPLGEEYTLALAASVTLARRQGPVVTNLSTSRIIDAICARHGVEVFRTPVGEAHVVAGMRAHGAVIGGEGNGGVIHPRAHYGRDGLVAAALMCQALVAGERTLRELADTLPRLYMVKEKTTRPEGAWEEAVGALRAALPEHSTESTDGIRLSREDEWIHVRPSGTEPVVRLIAESPSQRRTEELLVSARRALRGDS